MMDGNLYAVQRHLCALIDEQAERISELEERLEDAIRPIWKLCGCPVCSDCIHDPQTGMN